MKNLKIGFLMTLLTIIGLQANAVELDDVASPNEIYEELNQNFGVSQELNSNMLFNVGAPSIYVLIDKSDQQLYLWINGEYNGTWLVSTGKNKRVCAPTGRCYFANTPAGTFRPYALYREYVSRTWKVPMDFAIFFNGGIALHETHHTSALGRPGSGGCVRQSPRNASYLFNLVSRYGKSNTVIRVRE